MQLTSGRRAWTRSSMVSKCVASATPCCIRPTIACPACPAPRVRTASTAPASTSGSTAAIRTPARCASRRSTEHTCMCTRAAANNTPRFFQSTRRTRLAAPPLTAAALSRPVAYPWKPTTEEAHPAAPNATTATAILAAASRAPREQSSSGKLSQFRRDTWEDDVSHRQLRSSHTCSHSA